MKKKRSLILIGSVCLALMLAALLFPGCAKPAAPAEETAKLREELAAEKAKTAEAEAEVSELEAEIAELRTPAEVYELKCQCGFGPGTWPYEWLGTVTERIELESGGRIDITLYAMDVLLPNTEVFGAVVEGVLEIACTAGCYWSGIVGPIADVETSLPGSFKTSEEAYNFCHFYKDGAFEKLLRQEYAKLGVVYVSFLPENCAETILLNWELSEENDFSGKIVREAGTDALIYEKLGASTMYLPAAECYTALQTGVVDAIGYGGPGEMMGLGLHEVSKYIMWPPLCAESNNNILANPSLWDSLPDDLKAILEGGFEEGLFRFSATASEQDTLAIAAMSKAGMKVVSFPWETISEAAYAVWDEMAAEDEVVAEAIELVKGFLSERR